MSNKYLITTTGVSFVQAKMILTFIYEYAPVFYFGGLIARVTKPIVNYKYNYLIALD